MGKKKEKRKSMKKIALQLQQVGFYSKIKAYKEEKGWGYELHIANNKKYCLKKLVFTKKNAKFSMHFHKDKTETWYVEKGKFQVNYICTYDAERKSTTIEEGDVWTNPTLFPHQLICLADEAIITEVSTFDKPEDNYRIEPGDSQNVLEEK